MSDGKEVPSPTPQPKYSRYRSVRHNAKVAAEPEPEQSPPQKEDRDLGRTKSMSRYRRSRAVSKPEQFAASSAPPIPVMPDAHTKSLNSSSRVEINVARKDREYESGSQKPQRPVTGTARPVPGQPRENENERLQRKLKEFQEREAQLLRELAQKEKDEQERLSRQQAAEEAEQARLAQEEAVRLLAEQKRKDLERLEAELEAAAPLSPSLTSPREKLRFFSRKRAATKASPPPTSRTSRSGSGTTSPLPSKSVEQPREIEPPEVIEKPRAIEKGGGGVVPQTDAPISASNAGERRVLIRCKQSSINLPITPETTPVDLIYSAANIMSQNIIPSTAILIESYTQLGLERRIRRYEHIRDIMNSWDRDTQNALTLQNSDTPKFDTDLDASYVFKHPPADVTVYMYHSQKPGKWNKRFITLLSSGQIFLAKKSGAKMSDKDVQNICHLSDFDIYTLTPQQIRKSLKPPKKHCYAIKSQQKTTMFLSTENFVHFFSTDDEALSDKWYAAVQKWRSWYLVYKKGEGKKETTGKKVAELSTEVTLGTRRGRTHTVKVSVDESPYTIGSFTPLMNLGRFGSGEDEIDSEDENRPRQIPFHLRNGASVSPLPSKRESKRHPPPVSYKLPPEAEAEAEFSSNSLLGRTYSQRQRLQKERDAAAQQGQPFIEGPSLLNGVTHQRTGSMKSSPAKRPGTSVGPGQPKPLLDFTPQFKEAPQWDRTGKGRGVTAPEGIPLVEAATTPESGLADIPKAAIFRRDRAGSEAVPFGGGGRPPAIAGNLVNRGRPNHE